MVRIPIIEPKTWARVNSHQLRVMMVPFGILLIVPLLSSLFIFLAQCESVLATACSTMGNYAGYGLFIWE